MTVERKYYSVCIFIFCSIIYKYYTVTGPCERKEKQVEPAILKEDKRSQNFTKQSDKERKIWSLLTTP